MGEVRPVPALVHIGYHKTATTFLQERLFKNTESFHQPWSIAELDDNIAQADPLRFDPVATANRLNAAARPGPGVAVVSHEDLVGHPYSAGITGRYIADRIMELFSESIVLIVVREQRSMLASTYKQYVRAGGALSPEDWVAPAPNERRVPGFELRHFEYDRLAGYYLDHLGPDRVRVMLFEDFRRDMNGFVSEICTLAHTPVPPVDESVVNVGLSAAGAATKRWVNRLLVRDAANPAPLLPIPDGARRIDAVAQRLDRRMPKSVRQRGEARLRSTVNQLCAGQFGASNRQLADRFGLDLEAHGYDTA